MLSPIEAQSLYQTSSILQALLLTYGFTLLQATTLKVMDKLNAQIKLLSNTSVYIVTTIKITGLNSYVKIVDDGLYFIFSFYFILLYFSFSF